MSRVGKLPILIPEGVTVDMSNLTIKVQKGNNSLTKTFLGDISLAIVNNAVVVTPTAQTTKAREMWGTARNIINNMVKGVYSGFKEELDVIGVGYRASVSGKYLNLTLGKSHNTVIEIPEGVKVNTPKQDLIELESSDKEKLGQFISIIKSQRPPEPYKGKGIKKKGEYIIRKEGKKG